jgi:hypothetical protein
MAADLAGAWRAEPRRTDEIEAACVRIEVATEYAVPDGLFVGFLSNDVQLDARDILGTSQARPAADRQNRPEPGPALA